jgi:hypothetical protein|tara:strand:+ start:1649 stop:2146 length:498 start_codon:yes stop_codon:yes gene_type:complete
MKLFKNVLKEETLTIVNNELNNNIRKDVWGSNRRHWASFLTSNNLGTVSTRYVSDDCAAKVLEDIKPLVPKAKDIGVMMYIWDFGSGISLHDDSQYIFGGTIYLNANWQPDYGGWFIWKDEKEKWNAELPEFNNLILNDKGELHTVTPISHSSPEVRFTLQIFGE